MSFFVRFYCVLMVSSLFSQHLFSVSNTPVDTFSDNKKKNVVARLAPQGCFSEGAFREIITYEHDPHLLYERSCFLKLYPYDSQTKQNQILALLEKAAQWGHPEALYETGHLFEAARRGVAKAQYDCALQCLEAEAYEATIRWLKKAARPRYLLPVSSFDLKRGVFVTSPRSYCFEPAVCKLEEVVLEQKEKRFKKNLDSARNGDIVAQYCVIRNLVEKNKVDMALTFFEEAEETILMHMLCSQNGGDVKSMDLSAFRQYIGKSGAYEVVGQLAQNGNDRAYHLFNVSHYSWVVINALLGECEKSELRESIEFFEQIASKEKKVPKKKNKSKKSKNKRGGRVKRKNGNKCLRGVQIISALYCLLAKKYDEENDVEGLAQSLEKALEYCSGNACASRSLGNVYLVKAEKNKDKMLFRKGFRLLEKAADLGDAEASCSVGCCYACSDRFAWSGMNLEQNSKKAEEYLKAAINGGNKKAHRFLCNYYDGKGKHKMALELLAKVFDENSSEDFLNRGLYNLGAKNREEAINDLEKAKEMKNVRAAAKLASVYLSREDCSNEEACHKAVGALIYALSNGAIDNEKQFFSKDVENAFTEVIIKLVCAVHKSGDKKIGELLQMLLKLLEDKGVCKFVGFVNVPLGKEPVLRGSAFGRGEVESVIKICV